jgi:hypothetical protein
LHLSDDLLMLKMRQLLGLALLAVMATGCHTITNLTPSQQPRNENGLYPVEMKWDHREQAVRKESAKPYVMVGKDMYPMEHTKYVGDRWETLVPVPADRDALYYRFKIDYLVNGFGQPYSDSRLSPEYKLTIIDKK